MSNYGVSSTYGVRSNYGVLDDEGVRPNYGIGSGDSWSPANLFGPTDVGLWYDYAAITPEMLAWRRNLLTYSEQFDNAAWTKARSGVALVPVVTANQAANPLNGQVDADLVVFNLNGGTTASDISQLEQGPTIPSLIYSSSVWARTSDGSTVSMQFAGPFGSAATVTITPTWQRFSVTDTAIGNGPWRLRLRGSGGTSPTASVFIWGAQLEQSSSVSAYQRITDFTSDFVAAFPTTAIYQDSTGVTPVTALGQPVGLVLDKSRGGVSNLGPELVTNGDFSDGLTGWTATAATASVTGGVATVSQVSVGTAGSIYRSISVVAGQCYVLQGDISIVSGTAAVGTQVAIRATSDQFSTLLASVQWDSASRTVIYRAASTGTVFLHARVSAASGLLVANFDNISVREVPGNHAIQSTSTARPVWDARKNVVLRSEEFDNAAWTTAAVGSVAVANQVAAPDGTLTADLLREDTSTGNHYNSQSPTVTNAAHTFSVYYKIASGTRKLALYHSGTNVGRQFDATGNISAGAFNTPAGGFGVEALGNGWYRAWITTTPAAGTASWRLWLVTSADVLSYAGDGTSGYYVWGAQVELGSTATTYQRVTTATDYADVGFSRGALFDGSDDFLVTAANLVMSSTDEVTVIVGVDKQRPQGTASVLLELSSSVANNGTFQIAAPSVGVQYAYVSRGTATSDSFVDNAVFAAPRRDVMTGISDISSDVNLLRINGTQLNSSTADQGTGNYGSYLLYMGRRNGTSLPFLGRIMQLIIIGRVLSAAELAQVERYVANQSGVLIP